MNNTAAVALICSRFTVGLVISGLPVTPSLWRNKHRAGRVGVNWAGLRQVVLKSPPTDRRSAVPGGGGGRWSVRHGLGTAPSTGRLTDGERGGGDGAGRGGGRGTRLPDDVTAGQRRRPDSQRDSRPPPESHQGRDGPERTAQPASHHHNHHHPAGCLSA